MAKQKQQTDNSLMIIIIVATIAIVILITTSEGTFSSVGEKGKISVKKDFLQGNIDKNLIGRTFRARIDGIIDKTPWIKEVRGLGAMMAIEICDPKTGSPDKERTSNIHQHALKHGLIMITAGTFGNVIRTLMPLNIDEETLEEGLDILCRALII